MACQAIHMWTLNGLVAAFLDLIIAYFLLCASAVFFFASKFLGLFGLKLPCPCDGMISNNPSKDHCLNRILADFPARKVSNVQLSLKNKFPFKESVWDRDYDRDIDEDNRVNEILEIEGDASCSSVSNSERQLNVVKRECVTRNEKRDMKGKSRLHWRRRGASDHGNYSSVSSCDLSLHEEIFGGIHHSSSYNDGNEIEGGSSLLFVYGDEARDIDNKKPFSVVERKRSVQNNVQVDNNSNEDIATKKNVMSVEELQEEIHFSGEYKNTIRLLEQSLKEEHSARNALHIELEKERSAAASAADEVMAMISRLQEEKASVEMEARQYRKITEAKAAYDAEEIIILKEILIKREMEKLFLEKEIEAYRLMVSPGNQLLEADGADRGDARQQPLAFSVDLTDDPMTMLRQLSASIDEKVMKQQMCANGAMNESSSMHYKDKKYSFQKQEKLGGKSRQISGCTSDGNLNLQETAASTDLYSLPKGMQEFTVLDKSIPKEENELDKVEEINFGNTLDEKNVLTFNGTKTSYLCDTESLKQQVPREFSSSPDRKYEKDSLVCDVYVVSDGESLGNVENISKSEVLSVDHSYEAGVKSSALFESPVMDIVLISTDHPCTNDIHAEAGIKESSSIKDQGFPPLDPKSRSYDLQRSSSFVTSRGLPPVGQKSRSSDLRRSSIAVVDCDRVKIDNEIEKLHERLRIIQEGKERLSFSTANHDSKNSQLKLIEDIAHPVQKICQVKGHGATVRQVSLPLPTSKALSKKKRYGSISSAFKINT